MLSYEICSSCTQRCIYEIYRCTPVVHSGSQKRDTRGRLIGQSSHFHFRDAAISGVASKAEEGAQVVKSVTLVRLIGKSSSQVPRLL